MLGVTVKEVVLRNHEVSFVKIINNDYRHFCGEYDKFLLRFSGTDVWHDKLKGYAISEDGKLLELWL